jgi:hypothetical protein
LQPHCGLDGKKDQEVNGAKLQIRRAVKKQFHACMPLHDHIPTSDPMWLENVALSCFTHGLPLSYA